MKTPFLFPIGLLLLAPTLLWSGPAPANSELVIDDAFDRDELGQGWYINTGNWKIQDGVLRASEIPADQHSAAARRIIETHNAVYELRFRFTGAGKSFHFGFDPAKGELDKTGHLFSVIVTPTSWKLMKHVDKKRPKEDPNEVLDQQTVAFETGIWYELRVTTEGTNVTAEITGQGQLAGTHPTFGVKKPTLVFRCIGDGVEIDDLKTWIPMKDL